jgi:hypothetical protein
MTRLAQNIQSNKEHHSSKDLILEQLYQKRTPFDFSRNSYNGIINGATFGNGGLVLDSDNDFVNFGDVTELNNAGEFTIIIEFSQNVLSVIGNIWNKNVANINNRMLIFTFTDNRIYFDMNTPSFFRATFIYTPVMAAGIKANMAVVFKGSEPTPSNRLKIFVNRARQSLTFNTDFPATTPSMPGDFLFGRNSATSLDGEILRALVYNRALSEEQINRIIFKPNIRYKRRSKPRRFFITPTPVTDGLLGLNSFKQSGRELGFNQDR